MGTGQISNNKNRKKQYEELKAKGICYRCRKRKARKDRTTCQKCADSACKFQSIRRESRRYKKQSQK